MVKTITVTDDAYEMLKRMKTGDESFSEVIRRVAEPRIRLKDYLGVLPKDDLERARKALHERKASFSRDIEERRKRVHSR